MQGRLWTGVNEWLQTRCSISLSPRETWGLQVPLCRWEPCPRVVLKPLPMLTLAARCTHNTRAGDTKWSGLGWWPQLLCAGHQEQPVLGTLTARPVQMTRCPFWLLGTQKQQEKCGKGSRTQHISTHTYIQHVTNWRWHVARTHTHTKDQAHV